MFFSKEFENEDYLNLNKELNADTIEQNIDIELPEQYPLQDAAEDSKPILKEDTKFTTVLLLLISSLLTMFVLIYLKLKRKKHSITINDKIYEKYNLLADFDFVNEGTEKLVLRARFSNHPVTNDDLKYMDNQIVLLQSKIKKEYPLFKRVWIFLKYRLKVI